MARVKRGVQARARHKKVLKLAKGYYAARSRTYRMAKQAVIKASQYAYAHRKQKKRQFRALWIVRISAACRLNDMRYSQFINGMLKAGITLDRKVLADLALFDADAFKGLVQKAKEALEGKVFVSDEVTPKAKKAEKPAKAEKADPTETAEIVEAVEKPAKKAVAKPKKVKAE